MRTTLTNFRYKDRGYKIDAKWDADANVWIATSDDLPGLVIEADSWRTMLKEIELTAPELIELSSTR
jgi:Domain of unknown function (DUF1902)